MSHKILVSDPISEDGLQIILNHKDFEVDIQTDLTEKELLNIIDNYDGLIVRSQTQVTERIINQATQLKIIARAGVGIDNIDINAATLKGILVINAPDGNTISATEHSVAMLLAMARNIPQAHQSLRHKEWNRKAFRGIELYSKTLAVIGAGRIGLGVAKRAQSFGMKILAKVRFCYCTHTSYTKNTWHCWGSFFKKAKSSLQIINVARGGIIDESTLVNALDDGLIDRAALDVFRHEPPIDSPLIAHEKIVVTPHLGASTVEAQEKVAVSVSEEIVEILTNGTVKHAVNAPKMDLDNVDENIKNFVDLSTTIGEFSI
ncbi:NAD(P)-dependent oxidoreductase [Staphylococcus saccharolyticus]|uniref:NAD(P)-dependent oxidoreductase n=1 Tax=Staphylococcus saccharolyticus TaxID=33028 RepID=UPI0032DEE72B